MKVYTKTGDKGTTALVGGKRVPKNNIRIEAYGTTDELVSVLALLKDYKIDEVHKAFILQIMNELMDIAAILATDCDGCYDNIPKLSEKSIVHLEKEIDRLDANLPPLKAFIIPGGHLAVSTCHLARTVCRRTERVVLTLADMELVPTEVLRYFNRLSDYLFVLARQLGVELNINEIIWKPGLLQKD